MTILRRIYHAPELFQLVATFGVVLIFQDATLAIWGGQKTSWDRVHPGLIGPCASSENQSRNMIWR